MIENKVISFPGIKEAILVSGEDIQNEGYEVPYLFIVPEQKQEQERLIVELDQYLDEILFPEEKPKDIFVIDKKPISHFKTDRRLLQDRIRDYNKNSYGS